MQTRRECIDNTSNMRIKQKSNHFIIKVTKLALRSYLFLLIMDKLMKSVQEAPLYIMFTVSCVYSR